MQAVKTKGTIGPAPVGRFNERVDAGEDRIPLTHLFDDPDDDYWMWDYRVGGFTLADCTTIPKPPACNFNSLPLPSYGRDVAGTATLKVDLHGGTNTPHRATVSIGTTVLGDIAWSDILPISAQFSVDHSVLEDGQSVVTVTGAGSGGAVPSVFYIDDLSLRYSRRHNAFDNRLEADSSGQSVVTVDGFSNNALLVFYTDDPLRPRLVRSPAIETSNNGFKVSFKASKKQATKFVATTSDALLTPITVYADLPSNLRDPGNAADYIVITASHMLSTAQVLANFRASQGYTVRVIDIEDVYDEFSYGLRNPNALWRFLQHAHTTWARAPRYVVLAGDGSYDYKNALGNGDSIVPVLLTPTPDGLVPSDNLYVDVEGNDYVAEFAVGRLPAVDAAELSAMITKLIAYESSVGAWADQAVVVADAPDLGGHFPSDSEAIAAIIETGMSVDRIHRDEAVDVNSACGSHQSCLIDALNEGRAFFNFVGHGNFVNLGKGGLLRDWSDPLYRSGSRGRRLKGDKAGKGVGEGKASGSRSGMMLFTKTKHPGGTHEWTTPHAPDDVPEGRLCRTGVGRPRGARHGQRAQSSVRGVTPDAVPSTRSRWRSARAALRQGRS